MNIDLHVIAVVALAAIAACWAGVYFYRVNTPKMGGREQSVTGAVGSPETPEPEDVVSFSVYTEKCLEKGEPFTIDVWACLNRDKQRIEEYLSRSGNVEDRGLSLSHRIPSGATVSIRFTPLYLKHANKKFGRSKTMSREIKWNGQPSSVSFPVVAPRRVKLKKWQEKLEILANGIYAGDLYVNFDFAEGKIVDTRFDRVKRAFASYSSLDRSEVLGRVAILEQILGIEVFVDILNLRGGEPWKERLYREVESSDKFLLFWSANAAASEWVEKEWRHALKHRDLSFIEPVPLRPAKAPGPLRSLQFSDRFAMLADYHDQNKTGKRN